MFSNSKKNPDEETTELDKPALERMSAREEEITYQAVPRNIAPGVLESLQKWRIRFELVSDPEQSFGLDIYGDIEIGRGDDSGPEYVDLSRYNALELGVSRRHIRLRPSESSLMVMDLGSTNQTRKNGRPIGVNTPYALIDEDILGLGALQLRLRIIERPKSEMVAIYKKADLADALAQTAKTITSQLEFEEVLGQVVEMAMSLTDAEETAVWLVDELSGELKLVAERGIEEDSIRNIRFSITNSLVGKVMQSGAPHRENREATDEQIKIKTGYLAEAIILIPIALGGVPFGVLGAIQRERGRPHFSERDERLLVAIADFAAIAVQNARLYQATDQALAQRVNELATLNELSHALSSSLDLSVVYNVLVEQFRKHWDIEQVILWLVIPEAEASSLVLFAEHGSADILQEQSQQIEKFAYQAWESKQSQLADLAIMQDPFKGMDKESTVEIQARSIACLPLLIQDLPVGVLCLVGGEKGSFTPEVVTRLETIANPVATAIQNARLFSQSEQERAIINAMASALSQPLMILNEQGQLVVSNQAANDLLKLNRTEMLDGIREGKGKTTEITIGDETFLSTIEHVSEVGAIAVMQDITYLKKLESARLEFIHALAHDLRGPMSSIQIFGELLGVVEKPSQKGQEYLSAISSAAENVLKMIDQLLDIALLTEAPGSYREACNLEEIINMTVSDLEGIAVKKSITVRFRSSGESYLIMGDKTRLYRSMLNLIDNAIKYATESTVVDVMLNFDPEHITIRVLDDGEGIPEEDIPHLFEKYYRGHQKESGKTGVGLGLVLVHATVKAHDGQISVRNVEGHGAEFTITLPASLRVKPS
jgi:signal transduction histidine kinase/pSer/pThr/pTyr-binding forkhead associated (FHA) protein